jgi:hypothetical protein
MRRSTALTFAMIKTSNLRNMALLGSGAGALGLAGLAGAAYMDPRVFGLPDGDLTPQERVAAQARSRQRYADADLAQNIARKTEFNERMAAKQRANDLATNLSDRASLGMFRPSTSPSMVFTEEEARANLAPNMSDRIFGLGRATASRPSMVFTEEEARANLAPNMSDRIFGLGRMSGVPLS